jgi:hypothetical protein
MDGAQQMAAVAKAVTDAADRTLRREMLRGLRKAAQPAAAAVAPSALRTLPKRGGLAAYVASGRVTVRTRLAGRSPGVRIADVRTKTGGKVALIKIDEGKLRHPIRQRKVERARGRKPIWVSQNVTPGFFTKPMQTAAPLARHELKKVLDQTAEKIAASAR